MWRPVPFPVGWFCPPCELQENVFPQTYILRRHLSPNRPCPHPYVEICVCSLATRKRVSRKPVGCLYNQPPLCCFYRFCGLDDPNTSLVLCVCTCVFLCLCARRMMGRLMVWAIDWGNQWQRKQQRPHAVQRTRANAPGYRVGGLRGTAPVALSFSLAGMCKREEGSCKITCRNSHLHCVKQRR